MENELAPERVKFLAKDFKRGFIAYCGFRAKKIRPGFFESEVRLEEHHRQQDGFVHAGVMAAMADHTAGYAAYTTVDDSLRILSVEFKINMLKPAYGRVLRCRGRVLRGGHRIIVVEFEVYDVRDAGEALVAKAMVTLMAVPAEKMGSHRLSENGS
ncbi:Thioesterase [Olavius algarvensis associated proteobacterium Delta 3]|nr:Thioesterase [Olavius algarvensis associated proteobacterium Delta 3]